jgi:hypothetical protein
MSWLSLLLILGFIYFFIKKQYKVQCLENEQTFEDRKASHMRIQEITDTYKNSKRIQLREEFLKRLQEMEETDDGDKKTGDASR